jgi:hypothetical protein
MRPDEDEWAFADAMRSAAQRLADDVRSKRDTMDNVDALTILPSTWERPLFECEACGRLHVFARDGVRCTYAPESPGRGVLRGRGSAQ